MRRTLVVLCMALLLNLITTTPAMATITATVIEQGSCTTSGSPATCTTGNTVTPVSGQLVLVFMSISSNNYGCVAGTNGLAVTWTNVNTISRATVLRGVSSSSVAGTLTLRDDNSSTCAGTGNSGVKINYLVLTYTSVNQTTNQGVRQNGAASSNPSSVTSLVVSLAAFGNVNNATVYTANMNQDTTFTANTDWAVALNATSFPNTVGVGLKLTNDTSPNGGTFGVSSIIHAVALELVFDLTAPKRIKIRQN